MYIALGILAVVLGAVVIWFNIGYSPMSRAFERDAARLIASQAESSEVFTEEDFADHPRLIREYIRSCGYIGTPKMAYLEAVLRDSELILAKTGPVLRTDYTQYNYRDLPTRQALIESRMFGVPFEGYDYYFDGNAGMKGMLGKAVTLFHQTGEDMDRAALVTYLAEAPLVPSALLQGYITFDEMGDSQLRGTIEYEGITATGVFTFADTGEVTSFTTEDRAQIATDGTAQYIPWSEVFEDYRTNEDGIRVPMRIKTIWHQDDGDFVYFDGTISELRFG